MSAWRRAAAGGGGTKTRNRLGRHKMVMSTQVKYDMKARYPQAENAPKQAWNNTKSNCFVDPEEHAKQGLTASPHAEESKVEEPSSNNPCSVDDEVVEEDLDMEALSNVYPAHKKLL